MLGNKVLEAEWGRRVQMSRSSVGEKQRELVWLEQREEGTGRGQGEKFLRHQMC